MKIPTIREQMFGDTNKKLNNIRAEMNEEIREKCFEIIDKKKEQKQAFGDDADGT